MGRCRKWLVGCGTCMPLVLAAVACTHTEHASGQWGYEGSIRPEYWAQLSPEYTVCGVGREQSPIDISDAVPSRMDALNFFYQDTPLRILNDGHTIQVAGDTAGFMQIGGSRYDLVELHFHRPSEHKVNGRSYEMEIHLVHRGIDGEPVFVGILMDQGERENSVLQKVWDYLPPDDRQQHLVEQVFINPGELLPAKRSFYSYSGSLTTAPCSERVKWYVMKQPILVSEQQVTQFSSLYRTNARPIQPSNGRVIEQSIR